MNTTEHTLTLIAEATAHGIDILFSNREIVLSQRGEMSPPADLLDELDAHANEIWATLYSHRQRGVNTPPVQNWTPAPREEQS